MTKTSTRPSTMGLLTVSMFALGISACGVVPPKVTYGDLATAGDGPFGYPFRPRRSVLVVSYVAADKRFTAEPAPSELDAEGKWIPLFQVSGIDNWKSTTQLKVSYVPETKLVDEIKITTSDNIADTITKVGNVVAAVAPIIAGVVAASSVADKVNFEPTTFDPAWAGESWRQDEINPNYCLRLRNVAVEQGLPLSQYIAARKGVSTSDFPVASCATGTLEVARCPSGPTNVGAANPERVRVTFAASDRVTPIGLPSSGAMKMNAVCGAVVTEADKQDRRELTNYLTALIDAVKKIEAAKKK